MANSLLIIDNSKQVGSRIRELLYELAQFNYKGQAFTAEEGLQKVRELHPAIIILDIAFPVGTGVSLIEQIRKVNPDTILILFTNYSHQVYREKCLALGADYFFDKSTEFELLIKCLEKISVKREGAL